MPATVPPRLTSSWLLPGKNTFKHCHFSSHCHQHLSSLPALPSLLILQPLPSCFQGITCIPSLSSPKRLLTSPVAEMALPIRVPSIEPTCKFGNIEENFSFFVHIWICTSRIANATRQARTLSSIFTTTPNLPNSILLLQKFFFNSDFFTPFLWICTIGYPRFVFVFFHKMIPSISRWFRLGWTHNDGHR